MAPNISPGTGPAPHQQENRPKKALSKQRTHLPLLTIVLIGFCVAVFFYDRSNAGTFFVGNTGRMVGPLFVENLGDYSLYAPSLEFDGEWYRTLTAGFIHLDGVHLGVNMLLLWLFGRRIEGRVGALMFGSLFFAGVLGGSLGAILVEPTTQTGGASGAIFALVGATTTLQLLAGRNVFTSGLVPLIIIEVALSFQSSVSLGGHLGGLVVGLVGGLFMGLERRRRNTLVIAPVAVAGLGFAAFAGIMAVVLPLQELSFRL